MTPLSKVIFFAVCLLIAVVPAKWIWSWYWAGRARKRWVESFAPKAAIKRMNQSRESHGVQSDRGNRRDVDPGAPRPQVSPQGVTLIHQRFDFRGSILMPSETMRITESTPVSPQGRPRK
mgnify:FL=1